MTNFTEHVELTVPRHASIAPLLANRLPLAVVTAMAIGMRMPNVSAMAMRMRSMCAMRMRGRGSG